MVSVTIRLRRLREAAPRIALGGPHTTSENNWDVELFLLGKPFRPGSTVEGSTPMYVLRELLHHLSPNVVRIHVDASLDELDACFLVEAATYLSISMKARAFSFQFMCDDAVHKEWIKKELRARSLAYMAER